MTQELTFVVRFHQPFLVASGNAGRGLNTLGHAGAPVPASQLKGAMRAAAQHVLCIDQKKLKPIFGSAEEKGKRATSGAWGWSNLGPTDAFIRWSAARNRIDSVTGTVMHEALAFEEELWQKPGATATFCIDRLKPLEPDMVQQHIAVLQAAACATTALGHNRNRGMGAVTIRPKKTLDDIHKVLAQVVAQ